MTSLFLELLIEIVFLVPFYLDAQIGVRGIKSLRKPALGDSLITAICDF